MRRPTAALPSMGDFAMLLRVAVCEAITDVGLWNKPTFCCAPPAQCCSGTFGPKGHDCAGP